MVIETWENEAEHLRFVDGKSWSEMAQAMASYFPNLTITQVREKVRDHCRQCDKYKGGAPKLVFSDMHEPFGLPNFPYFLRDVAKQYKCGEFICLGDGIDSHAISNHDTEPCALGAYTETDMAIQRLNIYYALFPDVTYIPGNHCLRVQNMAAKVGIGRRFLKDLHEVLGMPEGWKVVDDEIIIDDVLYTHGINCSGKNGALNKAIQERMSVCIGHAHSFGGVQYNANKRDRIFGMNVGCGVNENAYAFAYGKHNKYRCTIGCGVVFGSDNAIYVPMGKEYE